MVSSGGFDSSENSSLEIGCQGTPAGLHWRSDICTSPIATVSVVSLVVDFLTISTVISVLNQTKVKSNKKKQTDRLLNGN